MPEVLDQPGFDPFTIIAITVPLGLLYFASYLDLVRRDDLSLRRKLMWAAIVFFLVFIGVVIYFFMRPPRPPEGKRYGETVSRTGAIVSELETAVAAHAAGDVSDEEFLSRKRTLLGLDLPAT